MNPAYSEMLVVGTALSSLVIKKARDHNANIIFYFTSVTRHQHCQRDCQSVPGCVAEVSSQRKPIHQKSQLPSQLSRTVYSAKHPPLSTTARHLHSSSLTTHPPSMSSQKAVIIAGFPGIGKSHLHQSSSLTKSIKITDLDTSQFSHLNGKPNPAFPRNYIEALTPYLSRPNELVLVGVHDTVRAELVRRGVRFTLVYPEQSLKEEYMQRWTERGDHAGFLNKMRQSWEAFTSSCAAQKGCRHVVLKKGQFLGDVIGDIMARSA